MFGRLIGAIIGLAMMGMAGQARSAVLFSQTPSGVDGGSFSDFDHPQFVYDDFSLIQSSTIGTVTWRGSYALDNNITIADDFSLVFFQDTGLPGTSALGAQFATFHVVNDVNRQDTGIDFFGRDLFEYSVNLSGGLGLASGTYWLAIANSTVADADNWFWGRDSLGSSPYLVSQGPSATLGGPLLTNPTGDNYFILEGNVSAVPLPAALPLFLSSLAVFGFVARRRWSAAAA